MPPIRITRELAFAASLDAGNRAMSAGQRSTWNEEDADVASRVFNRLWPRCPHGIDPEELCYFCDQDVIPAGHPLSDKVCREEKSKY